MVIVKNLLIFGALIFLVNACSYPKYYDCKKCIVNIGESKENVEKTLGSPIDVKKNKDGTFNVTYPFSYPITDNINGVNAIKKPFVYHNVNKIVILYDCNWKVSSFTFKHK